MGLLALVLIGIIVLYLISALLLQIAVIIVAKSDIRFGRALWVSFVAGVALIILIIIEKIGPKELSAVVGFFVTSAIYGAMIFVTSAIYGAMIKAPGVDRKIGFGKGLLVTLVVIGMILGIVIAIVLVISIVAPGGRVALPG